MAPNPLPTRTRAEAPCLAMVRGRALVAANVAPEGNMSPTLKNICVTVFMLALAAITPSAYPQPKDSKPDLKIIKDDLLERGNFYYVKGIVHNPHSTPVKNVVIGYYIWKKWMGQEGHGTVIRDTGGLVQSMIRYIPPKQSVEFVATGGRNAPVMTVQSGLMPDSLNAEITAEWDK